MKKIIRKVVKAELITGRIHSGMYKLLLECGHHELRDKKGDALPESVVCHACSFIKKD